MGNYETEMGEENESVVRGRKKGMGWGGKQRKSTVRPSRKDY